MNRGLIYPGQVPLETDLLYAQQQGMLGLSKLAAALLGTATVVSGLTTTQTAVASMNVQVAAGEIYSLANLEATAYSSLPADTAHSILKQGISLDPVLLALTAPATVGFSVNYLIQAAFSEVDSVPVTLPYYNASNPATAYSGPGGSGVAQNTRRLGTVVLAAKAGMAATTGTQTTPAPDAGYVGLYVVTVAYGATTVVNANISIYPGAPFLGSGLLPLDNSAKPATTAFANLTGPVVGLSRNVKMAVAAASASATLTADEIVVETALGGAPWRLANFSKSVNLGINGVGGMDTGAAPVSGFVALYAIYNPATATSALLATNATAAVVSEVYAGANMPAGYTASALVGVWPTNGSGQFKPATMSGRLVEFADVNVLTTTAATAGATLSISAAVPRNAKRVGGQMTAGAVGSASYLYGRLSAASDLFGVKSFYANTSTGNLVSMAFVNLGISTPQQVYYSLAYGTTSQLSVDLSSYEF